MLKKGEEAPEGHKHVPCHIAFDTKFDLRHRARLLVGGNWNTLGHDETHPGGVGMDKVRMGLTLGKINNLKCCAADMSSTCLHELTREKVCFVSGPEFGELNGHRSQIDKSLHGLCSSGGRWNDKFAGCMRSE